MKYEVIEYLESTGTAFINTNIIPTLLYSLEMGFYYVLYDNVTDASATLFGCLPTWINNSFTLLVTPSKTGLYNCWGDKYTMIEKTGNTEYWNTLIGKWHILIFKNKETYIDGVKKLATANGTGDPITPIYIFSCNREEKSFGVGTTKRISYTKIFDENNTLILDLIPVKVNGVGYMFDKISKQLFGNSGTGEFVCGPKTGEHVYPYDAELEYLESTGTLYINTGFKPNQDTRIFTIMKCVTSNNYGRLFGAGTYNSKNSIMIDYENGATGNLHIKYGPKTAWTQVSSVKGDYNIHSYDYNKNEVYRDGVKVSEDTYTAFQCTANLGIFTYINTSNNPGSSTEFFKGRCYKFQIYDNGILVNDLIPVRIGTTGYLYDRISNRLFGNVGTGNFILGPDIIFNNRKDGISDLRRRIISNPKINNGINWTYEWTPSDGTPNSKYLTFNLQAGRVDVENDSIVITSSGTGSAKNVINFNQISNDISVLLFEYFIENSTENSKVNEMFYFYISGKNYPRTVRGQCGLILSNGNAGTRTVANRSSKKGEWHTIRITWKYSECRTIVQLDNNVTINNKTQLGSWTGEKINVMLTGWPWERSIANGGCQGGKFKIRNIKLYLK